MQGIAISNIVKGKVIDDPKELEKLLDLDQTGNLMFNVGYPFSGGEKKSDQAGQKIVVALLGVKMNSLSNARIIDFLQRIAFCDAIGVEIVPLPNGPQDLVPVYQRLKGYLDAGWELETNMSNMEQHDFFELQKFKKYQAILRDIDLAAQRSKETVLTLIGMEGKS